MTLLFYDFDFNTVFVETRIITSRWTVCYNDVGNFEAHLPLSSDALDVILENRYLVAVQNGLSAIVVGYELGDELIIYGRTCNWLLSKRLAPIFSQVSGPLGELCANFALSAFSDVENFSLGTVQNGDEAQIKGQETDAETLIKKSLANQNMGHSISFDIKNKSWVFEVTKGKDSDIIFSEANKNAYNLRLSSDILDFANCGYYTQNTANGKERIYIKSDDKKEGIYRWEKQLSSDNAEDAEIELSNAKIDNEVTLNVKNALFRKDYNLGDVVRVQIIKGKHKNTVKKRIVGVEIKYSQNVSYEMPIFDDIKEIGGDILE